MASSMFVPRGKSTGPSSGEVKIPTLSPDICDTVFTRFKTAATLVPASRLPEEKNKIAQVTVYSGTSPEDKSTLMGRQEYQLRIDGIEGVGHVHNAGQHALWAEIRGLLPIDYNARGWFYVGTELRQNEDKSETAFNYCRFEVYVSDVQYQAIRNAPTPATGPGSSKTLALS